MVVLFLAQNIEITKFFFIKTALLKSKIIAIFVKLLHTVSRSLVEIKKVRWSTPLGGHVYIHSHGLGCMAATPTAKPCEQCSR